MDAPVTWYGATHWLTNLLYDCLIWRKVDGSGYEGQAAQKWEAVNDVTWRFHLRPGLKFQNGEPLDASAVKWNIDRVRSHKDFMVQPQWEFVKDVRVVDPSTVDIVTNRPEAYFEWEVSYNGCELLPPKYMEQVGAQEFAKKPIGSGPYKLVEFTPGDRYVFEAWESYWAGRPQIDRVVYQVIKDRASQMAALLAGQIDLVSGVPIPDRPRLGSAKGVRLVDGPSDRMHLLYLRSDVESGNMEKKYPGYQPVTLDKRIRQAIGHALDRNQLAAIQGAAIPTLVRVGPAFPEGFASKYSGKTAVARWYSPDVAKQLVLEAGFDPSHGKRPKVYFDAPALQLGNEKEVAEAIAAMLTDVGFDVSTNVLDQSAYSEQILDPGNNRDILMITLGADAPLVPLFYTCEWQETVYHVCVKPWSDLGKQISQTIDPTRRLGLWSRWWNFFLDYAQTVPLYEIQNVYAINDRFSWTPRADGWMTFRGLTLKK
jgi:peptide/nickel transport system substrate-binding protein